MVPPADPAAALKALARATELQQRGRLDEAEAVYAKLIADDDGDATALINGGVLALARGRVPTAVERLRKAVALVPGNAVAHANLGFALVHAGAPAEALHALDRAVALKPDFAQAHNNRGIALMRLNRASDARDAFAAALSALPGFAEAAVNLGELCNRAGDTRAARQAFARVRPDDPRAPFAALGLAFADALDGRLDAAIAALEALTRSHPREVAAWQTLGAVRNWAWRHEAAEAAFRQALALAPTHRDARFGLASALLARARYAEGWPAFEASREGVDPPSPALRALPRWDGAPFDGTLVVHGEQGLGDAVQFARFVPVLRPRVGRLALLLDGYWEALAPLLGCLDGVDLVLTDDAVLGSLGEAARVSFLSLPFHAQAMPDALPAPPYLAPPADLRTLWAHCIGALPGRRIGLAWSVHARDDHPYVTRHKSIPPAALAPLLDVDGVTFVTLQPGPDGDPAPFGPRADRIAPLGRGVRDFGDTAAMIEALDAVVSVDTAVAHVAGALGKPVALLERFHGCWRWRLSPRTSPWYPSLRIFRQARFGEWNEAVADVATWIAAGRYQ
ncbi:MAG TPA: tetratricopeptide repeat protein [Casimicrobiaceae bacterium]|nr:tetratricopeptide repeat protein [Casimicrobiaceae bacterium]